MTSQGTSGADGRRAEFAVTPQPTPPLWLSAAKCGRSGCCSPAFLHWGQPVGHPARDRGLFVAVTATSLIPKDALKK